MLLESGSRESFTVTICYTFHTIAFKENESGMPKNELESKLILISLITCRISLVGLLVRIKFIHC